MTHKDSSKVIESVIQEMQAEGAVTFTPMLYHREQLIKWKYIELDDDELAGPSAGDLDNDVHPIFAQERFANITAADYELFEPALRLATLYITHPVLSRWWKHVYYGRTTFDEQSGREYIRTNDKEYSEEAYGVVNQIFHRMASYMVIWFRDISPTGPEKAQVLGESDVDDNGAIWISMHPCWWRYITQPVEKRRPPQDVLFHWCFAISLIHELAHCFYRCVQGIHLPEPYAFFADNENEMGWSWEWHVLGANIDFNLSQTEGVMGAQTEPVVEIPKGPVVKQRSYLRHPLGVTWTHQFLFKATWKKLESCEQDLEAQDPFSRARQLFKTPRTDQCIAKVPDMPWQWMDYRHETDAHIKRAEDRMWEKIRAHKDWTYWEDEVAREATIDNVQEAHDPTWSPGKYQRKDGRQHDTSVAPPTLGLVYGTMPLSRSEHDACGSSQ